MGRGIQTVVGGAAAAVALCLVGAGTSGAAGVPQAPVPGTIVAVYGDAANGFEVAYADGSAEYTTTWSEARAECSEYDRRVQRVRCRVSVRTRYAGLAATRDALAYQEERLTGL